MKTNTLMVGERNAKSLSDQDMLNVQSCAPRSLITNCNRSSNSNND